MADRNALGAIGLMLGAATMAVVMIGAMVVSEHLSGRVQLDEAVQVVSLSTVAR